MHGAIYTERSKNSKLGQADATYLSINGSCSDTCPLKQDNSCYAKTSYVGMINARLNRRAKNYSPLKLAKAEAQCIDRAYGGRKIPGNRPLRLHVSGDSRTIKGTRLIAKAVDRWLKRGGKVSWSYTHSWAHVPRKEWGKVSVLASIESVDQVESVRKQGYAPALIVSNFSSDKAFQIAGCKTKFIPCPAQTRDITCEKCRLCFDDNRLFQDGYGIAFAAHGVNREKTKQHLMVIE